MGMELNANLLERRASYHPDRPENIAAAVEGISDRIEASTRSFARDWPGAEVYPPQPMVSQMRAVLEKYREEGGEYRETVIENCGHTPHVEKAEELRRLLHEFLDEHD